MMEEEASRPSMSTPRGGDSDGDLRGSRGHLDIEALPPSETTGLMGRGAEMFKVISSQKVYSKVKSACNVVAIISGAGVAPFALLSDSELFIGCLNLVLVLVPLVYVLAKNMEVEKQNEKLKEEIAEVYYRMRAPPKVPPESKDLLANFIVTIIAIVLAGVAFSLVTMNEGRNYVYAATAITSFAIVFSGITKMLSARALRKSQNELLSILADLKALDKANTLVVETSVLEERNKAVLTKLAIQKRSSKKKLKGVVAKFEEEIQNLKAQLQARSEGGAGGRNSFGFNSTRDNNAAGSPAASQRRPPSAPSYSSPSYSASAFSYAGGPPPIPDYGSRPSSSSRDREIDREKEQPGDRSPDSYSRYSYGASRGKWADEAGPGDGDAADDASDAESVTDSASGKKDKKEKKERRKSRRKKGSRKDDPGDMSLIELT